MPVLNSKSYAKSKACVLDLTLDINKPTKPQPVDHIWKHGVPEFLKTHVADDIVSVKCGTKVVRFAVNIKMLPLSGNVVALHLESLPRENTATNSSEYSTGLSIRMQRTGVDDVAANVDTLEAIHDHNIPNAQYAVKMVTAILAYFGFRTATFRDHARLTCDQAIGDEGPSMELWDDDKSSGGNAIVPMCSYRILTKGEGWYEAYGLRSLAQLLEPEMHKACMSALPTTDVAEIVACTVQLQAAVSKAIVDKSIVTGTSIKAVSRSREPYSLPIRETTTVLQWTSQLLVSLDGCRGKVKDVVESIFREDCEKGVELVNLLFRKRTIFVDAIDGVPVSKWPQEQAWMYACATSKSELFLSVFV